jgi:hypothetical protein
VDLVGETAGDALMYRFPQRNAPKRICYARTQTVGPRDGLSVYFAIATRDLVTSIPNKGSFKTMNMYDTDTFLIQGDPIMLRSAPVSSSGTIYVGTWAGKNQGVKRAEGGVVWGWVTVPNVTKSRKFE